MKSLKWCLGLLILCGCDQPPDGDRPATDAELGFHEALPYHGDWQEQAETDAVVDAIYEPLW